MYFISFGAWGQRYEAGGDELWMAVFHADVKPGKLERSFVIASATSSADISWSTHSLPSFWTRYVEPRTPSASRFCTLCQRRWACWTRDFSIRDSSLSELVYSSFREPSKVSSKCLRIQRRNARLHSRGFRYRLSLNEMEEAGSYREGVTTNTSSA